MIKFFIVIGRKCFSNYVAQSNYWIIQTKLLTALFKNNIGKEKKYVDQIKKISMRFISKEDLG